MKTRVTSTYRRLLRAVYAFLIAITALSAMPRNAHAQATAPAVYVTQLVLLGPAGVVSKYDASGAVIKEFNVVTGLRSPMGLAVAANNLFVANNKTGTVGKYDASSGAPINPNFITGLKGPIGLVVAGRSDDPPIPGRHTLYVASFGAGPGATGTVGFYDVTTAAADKDDFITGLSGPTGLAVAGNTLFVASGATAGLVGSYNASDGAVVNAKLITGLNAPTGLAVAANPSDPNKPFLFVVGSGTVGKYYAYSGKAINANFITGLNGASGVAVKGSTLFVTHVFPGAVSEYNVNTGALEPNSIKGLNVPTGIAVQD
jgi:hypothetical protein